MRIWEQNDCKKNKLEQMVEENKMVVVVVVVVLVLVLSAP